MHKIRDEKEIQNDNEETTNLFQPKIYSNIKLDKVFNIIYQIIKVLMIFQQDIKNQEEIDYIKEIK